METILQLDSNLEDTNEHEKNNEDLLKLHAENIDLRRQLKELNNRIDKALDVPILQPRSSSSLRKLINSPTSSEQPIQSPEKLDFRIRFRSQKLFHIDQAKDFENIITKLEETNTELRNNINLVSELTDPELQTEFQHIQKYLRKIFKLETTNFHCKIEIEETSKRITNLLQELKGKKSKDAALSNKRRMLQHQYFLKVLNHAEHDRIESISFLTKRSKELNKELMSCQEIIDSKTNLLSAYEQSLKDYNSEQSRYNQTRRQAIRKTSPSGRLVQKPEQLLERVTTAECFMPRERPRYLSTTPLKAIPERKRSIRSSANLKPSEAVKYLGLQDLKKTGNFEGFQQTANFGDFTKTSNFGGLQQTSNFKDVNPHTPSAVFKNIKLNPEEFEFTHNFTLEAARARTPMQ